MKSPVVKRSIVVAGHKTSVSLEEAFWNGMKEISGLRNMTLSELVGEIDGNRQQGNLSSATISAHARCRRLRRRTDHGRRPDRRFRRAHRKARLPRYASTLNH
jgi:predicted DNA-binding ribbon-helix-helix protein